MHTDTLNTETLNTRTLNTHTLNTEDPTYALGRSSDEYRRLTRQAAFLRPMTERFFRNAGLTRGMRVLDVGSGVGDVAFLAAELVGPEGEVVGIDLDGDALATARERAKQLGLTNVKFIEGDIRDTDLGGDFDAAVGRLVLLYFADPAQGLAEIVGRLRKGGVVAFQELDMDPAVLSVSYPEESLWSEIKNIIIRTFMAAGVHVRMGRRLLQTFVGAGLPVPSLMEETPVGAGPEFQGYSWMADTMKSMAPLAEKLGIAKMAELGIDTLTDRIRNDTVARDLMVWGPPLVGAYGCKP